MAGAPRGLHTKAAKARQMAASRALATPCSYCYSCQLLVLHCVGWGNIPAAQQVQKLPNKNAAPLAGMWRASRARQQAAAKRDGPGFQAAGELQAGGAVAAQAGGSCSRTPLRAPPAQRALEAQLSQQWHLLMASRAKRRAQAAASSSRGPPGRYPGKRGALTVRTRPRACGYRNCTANQTVEPIRLQPGRRV